ncbi:hypothetical protein L3Q82_016237 [Scortum barcoo]|uniref:Uncharacterized protein n=1 Tax=Scortum barcoo TaxID=214431 RepID=A0ACB8VSH5_9TELE|nr:hypothetical protein L3Q82_016237 [Scortum barcoo]
MQLGRTKLGSGGTAPEDEGETLFLLRQSRPPCFHVPSKRGGSSGLRRALVSQPKKDNPPRLLTQVTLTVDGNTTPTLALIDSDESLMDKALASSLGIILEPLQSPVSARDQPRTTEQIPNPSDYPDISKVPPCYHDLKEVFNKAKAMSLPPHREWDCAIDLLPGAPIPKARLYSISSFERKAMEEYIETSLQSGIRHHTPLIISGQEPGSSLWRFLVDCKADVDFTHVSPLHKNQWVFTDPPDRASSFEEFRAGVHMIHKQTLPPALPGGPRGVPRPAERHSFSSVSWVFPRPPPGGTCLEHLPREASRGHPKQMPKPPQLTPLDLMKEQRLYSELLPSDRASHPISKGAPSHPAEETHFGRLYPRSCPFGHYPKFMTIGEGGNVD